MITLKQEEGLIDQVKALSEIEFNSLLREMAQHLRRNNWEHMIDDCFEIESYEQELEEMTERMEKYRDEAHDTQRTIVKIRELL